MRPSTLASFAFLGLTSAQQPVNTGNKTQTPNLVVNGAFTNGTNDWIIQPSGASAIENGFLCVTVPGNGSANASFIQTVNNFTEIKNDVYFLNFTAYASRATNLWLNTQGSDTSAGGAPVRPNLNTTQALLTTSSHSFTFPYSPANQGDNTTLTIFLGLVDETTDICIRDISLHRINRFPYEQDTGAPVKVNQLGYLPNGPKQATLVSNATSPVPWTLITFFGDVVDSGMTVPFGNDTSSGLNVHTIDFSSYNVEGAGYRIVAGSGESYQFAISTSLYQSLRADSMQFFYQQRSGIAIDADIVGTQFARPAGHIQVYPNTGDAVTPCQYAWEGNITDYEPWTCNYTLDVTQGWYDAGDQGKYVVNGGVSTAQLMQAYERAVNMPGDYEHALGDGSLRIPERSNGYPDWLDEARWEMSFMLKMMVPANSPPQLFNGSYIDMSGLVHHKMHDNQWTPLPTLPNTDSTRRELHRPSTAGTLNMVATAAQSARLWQSYDAAFATQCLSAARVAYAAAIAAPVIYASGNDWDLGGGAYNDNDVTDEFFWAAAEMYITTNETAFLDDMAANPWGAINASAIFAPGAFGWSSTAALAYMDLATVPNSHPNRSAIIQAVVDGADAYIEIQAGQPTGSYLTSYPWGSNSNQLNSVQVVATAYDLTGNTTFRTAALAGIDYVLGRNALAQSYIRGYGTKATQNVHSRLYAWELTQFILQDYLVPRAPTGAMGGGANGSPADPPADDVLQGCIGQMCYVDDCNSYSTNEVAINWGSALAWVAAWAASQ